MNKEYFLNRLKERLPGNFSKYDYSLIPSEFKAVDKIKITCKEHGDFVQNVNNHLSSDGCPKCWEQRIKLAKLGTREDFIHNARLVHNSKYVYSKVVYSGFHKKVIITCKEHGDFVQAPATHLNGFGCSYCSGRRVNTKEFINKAKIVHGDFFGYEKVNYIDNTTKVIITCPIHGDFEQAPATHLNGFKCVSCRNDNLRSSSEEFISKATKLHNKYTYEKVNYTTNNIKVTITCPIHGDFLQTPGHHLSGKGCPTCNESTGERYINNILNKLNIEHVREYRILPHKYKYDFYLPEYNIYIEYHGIQHYKPVYYFGGDKQFQKTKRNDKVKIELIKRSTGLLIILKHTLDSLSKIEDELLRLFGVLHHQFLTNKESTKQDIFDSKIFLIKHGIAYMRK